MCVPCPALATVQTKKRKTRQSVARLPPTKNGAPILSEPIASLQRQPPGSRAPCPRRAAVRCAGLSTGFFYAFGCRQKPTRRPLCQEKHIQDTNSNTHPTPKSTAAATTEQTPTTKDITGHQRPARRCFPPQPTAPQAHCAFLVDSKSSAWSLPNTRGGAPHGPAVEARSEQPPSAAPP